MVKRKWTGLSWETCFEGGLTELSEETSQPEKMKLIFTVCAISIVVPAWRMRAALGPEQ